MSAGDQPQSIRLSWDELGSSVGSPFRSNWFRVSEDRLPMFDIATYTTENVHPMHEGIYPQRILEGFHQLALLDHLVNQVVYVDDPLWSGWNYGFDRVRFTSVASADDRIRVSGTITSIEPRGGGYVLGIDCRIEVEGREKPSVIAHWKVMWVRAQAPTAES